MVCKVERTLSPPFSPVQQALCCQSYKCLKLSPRLVFGSVLPLRPLPLCAPAFRGSCAPLFTFPGSPFPGASSSRPVRGESHPVSCPTGGDRPLTPFEIPRGRGSYPVPPGPLLSRPHPTDLVGRTPPQPLRRAWRLGRGSGRDRIGTGTGAER